MISTLLWIVGIIFFGYILYWVAVFFFALLGVKKVLHWASGEVNDLPREYAQMRKRVKNENSSSAPIEHFAKTTFVRWYKKLFK